VRVLVVNAGSSSLKVAVVEDGGQVARFDGLPDDAPDVDAVGHRVVHGGPDLGEPVVVDDAVLARLRELTELAPLHQPKSLHGLDEARRLLPEVPHVACFDTAFHRTIPAAASTHALPAAWRRPELRRYGFHGLSHAWASRRARELVPGARRVVVCHLGAGASLCAVLDGRSVDTTMGFTPLDGLVMATRSGSVDPGLLLWLLQNRHTDVDGLGEALEKRSGLLGLAGTADMAELLRRSDAGGDSADGRAARLAVDVYLHRLAGAVAAMTAALGGLDVLVFTGGVGENAATVRSRTAERLAYLGVALDPALNAAGEPDTDLSAPGAAVRTLVVTAREDLEIAAEVSHLLAGPAGQNG
jgi:acetate kinase